MKKKSSVIIVLVSIIFLLCLLVRRGEERIVVEPKRNEIASSLSKSKLEAISQIAQHTPSNSPTHESFEKHETSADPQTFNDMKELRALRQELLNNQIDRSDEKLRIKLFALVQTPNLVWTVRREAARALFAMAPVSDESERLKMMAQIDKRILHVAQMSDDELFDQVVSYVQ